MKCIKNSMYDITHLHSTYGLGTPVDISHSKVEFDVGNGNGCNFNDVDDDDCNF